MKIFLSLPMKGVPFKEILYNIECMKAEILQEIEADPKRFGVISLTEIEFVDNSRGISHPADDYKHPPLWYLGQAIQRLGDCDYIAFQEDWEFANGCRAEFEISRIYQIPQILPKYSGGYVIVEPGPFAGHDYYKKKGEAKPRVEVDPQSHYEKAMKQAFDDTEWFFNDMMDYLVHHGMDERQKADCYDMVNAIVDAAVLKYEYKKSILEGKNGKT